MGWFREGRSGAASVLGEEQGVDFATDEEGDAGHVHPEHEDDDGGEAAVCVCGGVGSEVGDIEAEGERCQGDEGGGSDASWGEETEFCVGIGSEAVGDGDA